MQLMNPAMLWALALLAVPVIIHLFNFRRYRKMPFTQVRFLKEITEEATARNRLKHLLVLISRLAALASLIIAFAQPYRPATSLMSHQPGSVVSVFVDNSFSMDLAGKDGLSKLEQAKQTAATIVKSFKPSDRFQLLTNDFESRHQRLMSREEILSRIEEIQTGAAARKMTDVFSRQQQACGTIFTSYYISDMQTWQINLAELPADSLSRLLLVPVPTDESSSNLYIDTCYVQEPFLLKDKPATVIAVIRNHSTEPVESMTVRLLINNHQKALATVTLPAGESREISLTFTPDFTGIARGEIQINDYPVTFDDRWYLSLTVRDKINVLLLSPRQENPFIRSAFSADPLFNLTFQSTAGIDYGAFRSFQSIVISDFPAFPTGLIAEVIKYLQGGGLVMLFPDTSVQLDSYNLFFDQAGTDLWETVVQTDLRADRLNFESSVLTGIFDLKKQRDRYIDYPVVKQFYKSVLSTGSLREGIISLQDGSSFLTCFTVGKGRLYVFSQAASLPAGNLVNHALFAPLLYRIAMHSGSMNPPFQVIGNEQPHLLTESFLAQDAVYRLINHQEGIEIIPPMITAAGITALNLKGLVHQAGYYQLYAGNENRMIDAIAFNFNRNESELKFYAPEVLQDQVRQSAFKNIAVLKSALRNVSEGTITEASGKPLWPWFILLTLLFLACETILLRWMK
jgi:hypothetical protein